MEAGVPDCVVCVVWVVVVPFWVVCEVVVWMVCEDWEKLAVGSRLGRVERPCSDRLRLEGKRGGTVTFTWLEIFSAEDELVAEGAFSAASLLTVAAFSEVLVVVVVGLSAAAAAVFSPDAAAALSTAAL